MTCPVCGRYGAPDPETGYDASTICPACRHDGWTEVLIDGLVQILREPETEPAP